METVEASQRIEAGDSCQVMDTRWGRNEKDDMHIMIELVYELKKKLMQMHPRAIDLVRNMISTSIFF
jgi:hypothetical protein